MQVGTGSMATDRPARYAKQLASHWSAKATVTGADGSAFQPSVLEGTTTVGDERTRVPETNTQTSTVRDDVDAVIVTFDNGSIVRMTPALGVLKLETQVPDDADLASFQDVVSRHLERFGQRDELHVVWDRAAL